jgi:hypothetical protein
VFCVKFGLGHVDLFNEDTNIRGAFSSRLLELRDVVLREDP